MNRKVLFPSLGLFGFGCLVIWFKWAPFRTAIGDAASCSKKNQKLPQGYYNIEVMLKGVARHNGEVGVCGTCMDARGMAEEELIEGTKRSTLDELTTWTAWADKIITF